MSWRLIGAWTLLIGSILGMAVTFPLWLLNRHPRPVLARAPSSARSLTRLVFEAANMTDRIHDGNG